jgi:hypothetical protein
MALAEQVKSGDAGERADLMERGCLPFSEEVLDALEIGWGGKGEETEAEGLRAGRADSIENGESAGALRGAGATFREEAGPRICEANAGGRFGEFQSLG